MKIIEALKQTKDLERKSKDILEKIQKYCADMDYETAVYADQRTEVGKWLQSYRDIVREIGRLKFCLSKTNVTIKVTIVIDGNEITKTICEWIERRKKLCAMERLAYANLSNRGLKDVRMQQSAGQIIESRVRYYFDPLLKDKMMDILGAEPSLIDSKLEIINATTDLIE